MYAVITGASSGIGKEIAILLAKRGYHLILTARREKRLQALKEKIEETYQVHVITICADLSKEEDCINVFQQSREYPVNIVVNAAGFGKVGNCTQVPMKEELAMIDTNLKAVHILTKLFANHMKHGRILNVASIAAFQPGPYFATYSATKSYVLQFSLALNYEMIRLHKDIRILTLCPGPVNTEFNAVAGTDFAMPAISARKCAKIAVDGIFKSRAVILPGLSVKCARLAAKFAPYFLILPVEYYIQTKKLGNVKK